MPRDYKVCYDDVDETIERIQTSVHRRSCGFVKFFSLFSCFDCGFRDTGSWVVHRGWGRLRRGTMVGLKC